MPLTTESGPVPSNIGAVLTLSGPAPHDVHALLAERVARIPRLRQRIQATPFGCGRPIWVDDASFRVQDHVVVAPGRPSPSASGWSGERLMIAVGHLLGTHLPQDRPLWGAMWVPDLEDDRWALVMIVHHVLADGIGGVAVLGALCDEAPGASGQADFPRPAPSSRDVCRDAWAARDRSLRGGGRNLVQANRERLAGFRELGWTKSAPRPAPRTSINRPSGRRRRVTITQVPLGDVVAAAHAAGATVNDLVLTATAGALAGILAQRGEHPERLVVSVPISARRTTTADDLGNAIGAITVDVPTAGGPRERLPAVKEQTAAGRESGQRGSSSRLIAGMAALLGTLGMAQWFVDRQRLMNTFETNVRGPSVRLHLGGCAIERVVPLANTPGNAAVTFGAMSYGGQLVIATYADPDILPEQDRLNDLVAEDLRELLAEG